MLIDEKLVWKKEFEIGVYEIDAEHQIFLRTIQKIDNAYNDHLDNEIIESYIKELYKYADFHFCSEENVMIINGYPDYEAHKMEHKKLLNTLSDLIGAFNVKYISRDELIELLTKWFVNHTTKVDLKLAYYLNGNP